mgnify:CR=1 FL=1
MKIPSLAQSVESLELSAIKQMAMKAAALKDVASLAWGLPSFRTPQHIRDEIKRALAKDPDLGKYSLPDGLPEFREIIAHRHFQVTGNRVNPNLNVLVTAGNMEGVMAILRTLLDPGDEVIVTDPGFASHLQQVLLSSGVPVPWRLRETDWSLNVETLHQLIGERCKAIILVSPSNPTGKIFSETALRQVGEIAVERGLLIVLDDPYSEFLFENRDRYFNLASVPDLSENIAYLFSFSKAHAMSGWRLGYMVVSEQLKRQVLKVHDATIICAPRISQVAGMAALSDASTHVRAFEAILAERRELICERLDRVPNVFRYVRPDGAYYVFPRIVTAHRNSATFALELLDKAGVAVTPGRAFGVCGEHHVRMAYCVSEDSINLAFDRIERHYGP